MFSVALGSSITI